MPKYKQKDKHVLRLKLNHVRSYANAHSLEKDQLYIVDDLQRVDIEHRVLQTSFLTIALCTEGSTSFIFNGQPLSLQKNDIFIGLGHQIIENAHHSEDFKMIAMLQSHQFAQEVLHSMLHLWPYSLQLIENPKLSLTETEVEWLLKGYRLLVARLANQNHTFLRQSVASFMQVFYLDICHMLEKRYPRDQRQHHTRNSGLFYEFMKLLMTHYKQQREVAWYAEQMGMTPKYLSEIMKMVSGRTAGHWISTMVILEIKRLLRNSSMSIQEIAMTLNFSNQSFLGKYFKNATGISPLDFRMSV